MKNIFPLFFVAIAITLFSCTKEYSLENGGNVGSNLIVGVDCRLSKIAYTDTSGIGTSLGALFATIDNADKVTKITDMDSVGLVVNFIASPVYFSDTVFINGNEYFLVDIITKRIKLLHALIDPSDPLSDQYEISYFYNGSGYLTSKFYTLTSNPGNPFYLVNYTYTAGNLTHMEAVQLINGDLDIDADVTYYTGISPKSYLYIFPDERGYPQYNQFYNFGVKPVNAIKDMKVRNYDPGNVVRDSSVTKFTNYILSRDNYVLSVIVNGDAQPSIPALKSRMDFSYKCK